MNGRDLTLGLVGALALGAVLGRRGSRATDPTFRVRSPAEGHQLIASKVYTDNWKKALAVTPTHREAVLVPCAGTKPFSSAPSHAHGYVPGLEGRAVDRYVVAEPLGIVPWAWEDTYPNNAYDFPPDQLRGKGRDLLVERIRAWFTEGPGRSYDRIWLALPGHHGRLVADATRDLSLPTEDVSITACRAAKACGTSVHRATSKAYVRYLKKTVVPGGARGSRDTDPTSSPAFRRWFGESKVVDGAGRPLVVYHGTATPTFEAFSFHHGINAPVPNAAYFGDTPAVANDAAGYGPGRAIYPVYLRMLRPLVIDAQGAHAIHLTERVVNALSRGRYDGVILENVREYFSEAPSTTYAVFDPTQIKSATGNRGTFDPTDPRISFNRGPAPTDAALRTLRAAMVKAARADTAYAPAKWKRAKDPLTGHCYGAAHLVQDRFGGEIVKGVVRGQAHAWNRLPGGREVDLTGSQYGGDGLHPLVQGEGVAASRSTNPRFARFAERVDAYLAWG